MIKGCSKKVVVVRNMESNVFEEAFFIVRPSGGVAAAKTEEDYLSEADSFLKKGESLGKSLPPLRKYHRDMRYFSKKQRFVRASLWLLFGMLLGTGGTLLLHFCGLLFP